MGYRKCNRLIRIASNLYSHVTTIQRHFAIPPELAQSLTQSPGASKWVDVIKDDVLLTAKLDYLIHGVGIEKDEIVEDMTLLAMKESPFHFVPPRLMAKREILYPFESQVEFCARLFDASKEEVYLAAARDLNVLTAKYPTKQWKTRSRPRGYRNVLHHDLGENDDEEEQRIRDIVEIFQRVGVGGGMMLHRFGDFSRFPAPEVQGCVDLIRKLFRVEKFSVLHLDNVSSLLNRGQLPRKARAPRTPRSSRDQAPQTKSVLLNLGFSQTTILNCSDILQFSEKQIMSGYQQLNDTVPSEGPLPMDPLTQSKLINLLQYFVEKEINRPAFDFNDEAAEVVGDGRKLMLTDFLEND